MVARRDRTNTPVFGKSQVQAMELCKSLHCPLKSSDRIWHKLRTVSGAERTVCNKLQERGIPCYSPSVRVKLNTVLGQKSVMFPGNVFAALTEQDLRDLSDHSLYRGN